MTIINGNTQEISRQHDGHSCGPLVIRVARSRMLGRPAPPVVVGGYNSEKLRAEAIKLLHSAWTSNALVIALEPPRKRKGQAGERVSQGGTGKRRKATY